MEADPWSLLSSASRRRQSSRQLRFDAFLGFDEVDGGEEDLRMEFACPFCSDDFDIFGLCCHIDEDHPPEEAKNGVCPICADKIAMDMVSHITTQHGSYFKMQRKRRYRKSSSSSQSTFSLLKKELRGGNLQTLLGGASFLAPNLEAVPDPVLLSFINSMSPSGSKCEVKSPSIDEESLDSKISEKNAVERVEPTLSLRDQEERAQRSAFMQELLLSTIFENNL